MRRISYTSTAIVGSVVMVLALRPPELLQYIVIFAASGLSAAFLLPVTMGLFWRRATAQGAIAAMLAGTGALLLLYSAKPILNVLEMGGVPSGLRLPSLLGFDPFVWAIAASAAAGIWVSLATPPPADRSLIAALFPSKETATA